MRLHKLSNSDWINLDGICFIGVSSEPLTMTTGPFWNRKTNETNQFKVTVDYHDGSQRWWKIHDFSDENDAQNIAFARADEIAKATNVKVGTKKKPSNS